MNYELAPDKTYIKGQLIPNKDEPKTGRFEYRYEHYSPPSFSPEDSANLKEHIKQNLLGIARQKVFDNIVDGREYFIKIEPVEEINYIDASFFSIKYHVVLRDPLDCKIGEYCTGLNFPKREHYATLIYAKPEPLPWVFDTEIKSRKLEYVNLIYAKDHRTGWWKRIKGIGDEDEELFRSWFK